MMGYLLDTSILILAARDTAPFKAIDSSLGLLRHDFQPAISIVTHGEILGFAKKRGWGENKLKLLQAIINRLVVIPIDQGSNHVERYAELSAASELGLNIGQNDLWIAATAIEYGLTLLTTDGDFDRCPEPLQYIRFHQETGVELSRRTY